MEIEHYEIVDQEGHWHVEYNGEPGMAYATKEAAFEAAFAGATNAVKAGHDVTIHVAGAVAGESALGNPDGFDAAS